MKKVSQLWVLWFFLLISGQLLWAQVTTATISGIVKDETGAVLPGVAVNVTNVGTGITRTAVTDDEGRYRVPELPPGNYDVEASLMGFQTVTRSGINLTVGRHAVIDVALQVGEITEKITVTGEASLVETSSAAMAGLIDDRQIRDLPLNSRNFVQLSLLETGVVQARSAGSSSVVGGGLKMSIQGARMDYNNFIMDGTSINSVNQQAIGGASDAALGVETIREFQVLTSNFSAEFGRSGGGVINVVTKSGTNNFDGSMFWFHRNDNLDARNFFDRDLPEFKRNQFGFTLGGPLRKDKTFFFGGYEGLREGLGRTFTTRVPTIQARQGILPRETVAVAASVKPYLELFPLPNGREFGDGTAELLRSGTEITNQDFYQARVDHVLSDSDSIFVRYTIDDSSKDTPRAIPTWLETDAVRSQYVTVEEKKIFSPKLLNIFRFGFNRSSVAFTQEALDNRVMDPNLWFLSAPNVVGLGALGVSGLGEPGGATNRPKIRLDNVFQWTDTVAYDAGGHSLKIGTEAQRIQTNEFDTFRGQGVFSFPSLTRFLLAQPSQFLGVTEESDYNRGYRQSLMALFLQDDIEVRSNLTVNVGVRWEFVTNPTEVNGKAAHFNDPLKDTTTIAGNPLMKLPKNNIAPRFGFAWDIFGDGKTAVRGGAGMFHQMIFRNYYFSSRLLPPFTVTFTGQAPTLTFPRPLAGVAPSGQLQSIEGVQYDNNQLPTMVQYNLNIQRELFPKTVLSLGYVGKRGLHMGRFVDPNTAIPEICPNCSSPLAQQVPAGTKFFPAGLQRRAPQWGQVRFKPLSAASWYNALQLRLNRRMAGGLSFQASYTWSHSTDDASGQLSGDFGNHEVLPQDPHDLKTERGRSSFDLEQVLVLNTVYDLPGRGLTGLAGSLFQGWQINGILNVTSGVPFTVENSAGLDRDRDRSTAASRPNLAPGKSNNPVLGGPDRYYDVSAFEMQPLGFYGNLGRNTVIGPGLVTFDFGLVKKTAISEGVNLSFRAEFFNLFNRANFGLPDRIAFRTAAGIPSAGAGRIDSTVTTSRELQFGLKLEF
ncbi:MAG: TonB-dependent receptor [Acidobacteria bacterium]|nr:TonB-dependent receptor [Acidobacteriota bacterium]